MAPLALRLGIIFLAASVPGQIVVDATGPARDIARRPTSGNGGGIGRKLPLALVIENRGTAPDREGKTEVDFILTNLGSAVLPIPASPSPAEFEPDDPKTAYTMTVLNLTMTIEQRHGGAGKETLLRGGARLYGVRSLPASLAMLGSGESIRVHALVTLPLHSNSETVGSLVAHADLSDETIRTVAGQTTADSREIGSTDSQIYSVQYLISGDRKPKN